MVVALETFFHKPEWEPLQGFDYQLLLGQGDMVFSFFSSISYYLEGPGHWGTRFPRLLLDLCDHGIVYYEQLDELLQELRTARREMDRFLIDEAIYDIGDLSRPIPWERYPDTEDITLANAWMMMRKDVTYYAAFEDLIQNYARPSKSPVYLKSFETFVDRKNPLKRENYGRDYWLKDTPKT